MRIHQHGQRLKLAVGDHVVDVATASNRSIPPDPAGLFEHWAALEALAARPDLAERAPLEELDPARLGPPVVGSRQVFALALNYAGHAREAGSDRPAAPATFTKFSSCLTGPTGEVVLAGPTTDWEVELVVVIGVGGAIAGYTVGQDLTDRSRQFQPPYPQFCLSKSLPGFGPIGPALVTLDELADPDDLALGCSIDGEVMQDGRTRDLIFSVPEVVSYLSSVLTLLPGDLIFTGTPSGIGSARDPKRFLQPGEVLSSWVEGIGEMAHRMVAADPT